MSATGVGAGNRVDITVKVNVHNMQDLNKISKRVNQQVNGMRSNFKKMGKEVGNVNLKIGAMDKSVNALGNQMGFIAFQWMFIAGMAGRALQQIKDFGMEIVEIGAKGTEQIIRAVHQTKNFGDTLEEAGMRAKATTNFIMEMARVTGMETPEVARAVKEVGKALHDVNGTIEVTTEVLKLATIEEMNVADAAKGFIGILQNYRTELESVEQITAVLVGVNQMSRVELGELIHAFEYTARQAADMGVTFEETAVMLGMMGDQLPAEQIGRQFARLLGDMRQNSVAANSQLKALGVTIYDLEGNMKPMPEIFSSMHRAMKLAGNESDKSRDELI